MTPSKSSARPAKKSSSAKKGAPAPEAPAAPKLPPVQHMLVPTHELMTVEEGNQLLQSLNTPVERLPKILYDDPGLFTDPQYRKLAETSEGARSVIGRLVRVRRPSPTAGEAAVYRLVVGGAAAHED